MLTTLLPIDALFAFHDGATRGGSGNLAILFVFVGVLGTAGWLIFSEMKWRNTLLVTAAGWVVILGLSFGF